ncbi:hypothetical protein ASG35_24300 [Burkholderia sp. Leaf177]|uniref:MBL fold metallo-hydrolase n=1 Tax=Burkholderia sp. Leaf177 TaxID=1736287 RepID=UPI0006FB6853|nr:MBL fold metallo-hydrolase [Burkholderia sp. Leaf177]KQR87235.1 hypothetical protein ASG35_24300 [Burkholderia sp. Leaf177]
MSAGDLSLQDERFSASLRERLTDSAAAPRNEEVVLYWLGQAGFVIEWREFRMLIDPYLSDSLAEKYKGTKFPHMRMMEAPVLPGELDRLDLVLCTHRHTDHMDPGTLQPLAQRFPDLRFVVPAAVTDEAIKRCGVGVERLFPVNAGERIEVFPGCFVSPVPSAHESLDMDDEGRFPWLGYVVEASGIRLYHSGDCVPYAGLAETVAAMKPHVAMLPVNGRDAERSGNGVPGNFTLDEAIALAKESGSSALIAHHFGLFDFNTVSNDVIDTCIEREAAKGFSMYRAKAETAWRLKLDISAE